MTGHGKDFALSHRDAGVRGYGAVLRLTSPGPLDEAAVKDLASQFMAQTSSACVEVGAKLIGHIKSLIKTETGSIKADILGRPESLFVAGHLENPVTRLDLTINCIVQGLSEDALASVTMDTLKKLAAERGLSLERTQGKSYDPLAAEAAHSGHDHHHSHANGHCRHGH